MPITYNYHLWIAKFFKGNVRMLITLWCGSSTSKLSESVTAYSKLKKIEVKLWFYRCYARFSIIMLALFIKFFIMWLHNGLCYKIGRDDFVMTRTKHVSRVLLEYSKKIFNHHHVSESLKLFQRSCWYFPT